MKSYELEKLLEDLEAGDRWRVSAEVKAAAKARVLAELEARGQHDYSRDRYLARGRELIRTLPT